MTSTAPGVDPGTETPSHDDGPGASAPGPATDDARRAPRRRDRDRGLSVGAAVFRFMVTSLVALVALAVAGLYLQRHLGENEAVRHARENADLIARGIVEPVLTDESLVAGTPDYARLDAVVRKRVLDDKVVRVKIWSPEGRVLYSDERRLVGKTFPLGDDDVAAITSGKTEADVSDLAKAENRYERDQGKLLQVYQGATAQPSGNRVLFELYEKFDEATADSRRLWESFAPPLVGAVLLLWLMQVPLAWRMAKRVQRGQEEREELLHKAVEASNIERRRVAADLHDGVVQQLAGTAYVLAAAEQRADVAPPSETKAAFAECVTSLRQAIRHLRSLIVEIHPPNLRSEGLAAALSDLTANLASRGIETSLDVTERLQIDSGTEELLFRGAQEAVRNIVAHSQAKHATIRVTSDGVRAVLMVEDDGRGFSEEDRARRRKDGHLGLGLLEDLAADMGGSLTLESRPGDGTRMRLEVPCR